MSPSPIHGIGERLREARLRRGMSVRGLARAVDLSASLISQIETGRSSLSVSTLYVITTALGISIEDVFGGTVDAGRMPTPAMAIASPATEPGPCTPAQKRRVGPVVRGTEREALQLDSGVTWELLGQLPDTHVDFLRITYAPGGSSSAGGLLMRHSGTEYGHVLSGQLTLTLGFDSYVLAPGDSVSFDSSTPHAFANEGGEPAIGVWFVLERPT
jgi:transcriptional regulator with XRE-family HTH domain